MKAEIQENATILVVDDDPTNLQVLLDQLKNSGFRILIAQDGEGALRQVDFAKPDLILLDVIMPGIDGFETCRRLKQNDASKDIPVIFLTAFSDPVDKVKGIEAGGVDYLTKPFDGLELLARVTTHLELRRYRKELEQTNRELQQAHKALLESRKQVELATKIDPLTQLSNRRDMLEKIRYEKIRFERNQKPFVLAICNLDNFKEFNDTFGHDCGDFVLVSVTCMMRSLVRKQDQIARWGGEEFLFLFPETDLEGGRVICEKIRKKIATHSYQYKEQGLLITGSWGVSVFNNFNMPIEDCIKKADHALYLGKERGKNCVVLSDPS
jgi:diguanylate cyclase (GGDEF)-like protein